MERLNESGQLRKLVKPLQVTLPTMLPLVKVLIKCYLRTQLVCRISAPSVEGMACFPVIVVMAARNQDGEAATIQPSSSGALIAIRGVLYAVISAEILERVMESTYFICISLFFSSKQSKETTSAINTYSIIESISLKFQSRNKSAYLCRII